MRLTVTGNHRKVMREINAIRKGRVRKALASAMTDTLFDARKQVVNRWWPGAVTVRNARFMGAAMRIARARSATLRGTLYDRLGRVAISYQEKGGTRTGRGGRRAIPTRYTERRKTGGGKVRANLKPRAPRVTKIDDALYKRVGRGKRAKLIKLYTLRKTVRQPRRFPVYKQLKRYALVVFPRHLTNRLERELQKQRTQ